MLRIAMLGFAHVHAKAAAQYGVVYSPDLDEVLQRQDIDAVVVNAPTVQHPDILLAAVAADKHIFTEKALTITTADANVVTEAIQNSDIRFMISLPRRTWPETLFMKQALDAGWLGDITMMRARLAHSGALDRWFSGPSLWFGDASQAGGGALFDLGCHIVDIMRWFLGEPVSVIAKVQNFSGNYDIDDQTLAIVEFRNGALGILDCTWVHRAGPNPVEIYGTEGFVGYGGQGEPMQVTSSRLQPDGIRGIIQPSVLPEALPSPMEQWVSAILHDTEMTITVEDGRNLTQLMDGIYEAAASKREVQF